MEFNLEKRVWWDYIEDDLQKLLETSAFLLNVVRSWGGDLKGGKEAFNDYSFCVFPAAKAYEGFLKKMFFDLGFINEGDYYGKQFRIGRALNPFLEDKYRYESVYDKVVSYCGGKKLADELWEAWKKGRNLIFHWFPEEKNVVTFEEAQDLVATILKAMDKMSTECKIKL
jgi:hypothetical protein